MKKKALFTALLLIAAVTIFAQQTKVTYQNKQVQENEEQKKNGPIAKFDKMEYDYGNIPRGKPQTATFTLTNEGKEPLIISYAKASCGCTNLKYDREPILPGKSSEISVTYNAAAPGNFVKTVVIRTNADSNQTILKIKGTVVNVVDPPPGTKQ